MRAESIADAAAGALGASFRHGLGVGPATRCGLPQSPRNGNRSTSIPNVARPGIPQRACAEVFLLHPSSFIRNPSPPFPRSPSLAS